MANNKIEFTDKVPESFWVDERNPLTELKPATVFLSNTKHQQFKHLLSEFKEVAYELYNSSSFDREKLAMELIDIQMSCETFLKILNYDAKQRQELRHKVILKNKSRGYYEESKNA